MNSPHRTRRSSNVLLAIVTTLLFVGMEAPLLGMKPKQKLFEQKIETNPDRNRSTVASITGKNRRNTLGAEDDDSSEIGSLSSERGSPDDFHLVDSPPIRNPRRQSSQRKFSIDQTHFQQQLTTESTRYRNQIEEAATATRAQLAQSLFRKHSSLQEEQNALEDFLDREKVYQRIEALHARQQEALKEICADQEQLVKERRSAKECFSLFCPSEKKIIARENAIHQKLVALVQEKVSSYSLELEWLLSFSPKRIALLDQSSSSSSTSNHDQQTAVERALTELQEVGQTFIENVCPSLRDSIEGSTLDSLSDKQLDFINAVIDLVRKTQLFILGYDSSSYITMSKEQLAEIEEGLAEKIRKLDPSPADRVDAEDVKVDPTIRARYLAAQKLLEHHKAQFLLMETTPEGETIKAASKSALTIHEKAQETEEEKKNSLESELNEIETADQPQLTTEIKKMEELHDHLLNAMLSYREIQDEAWIEKQCGNLNNLHDQIIDAIPFITAKATSLGVENTKQWPSPLKRILEKAEFRIDPPLFQPASPLEFLDTVMSLSKELHTERIIGTHGKIALEHAPNNRVETPFNEKTRREWISGTNLIRRAICITRGIEVLRAFDTQFWKKTQLSNSLKVHEVINFLFDHHQQPKYPSSFFVDPNMSHEDFLEMLSAPQAEKSPLSDKVIKIDQTTLEFNPFSKKQPNLPHEDIATAILRQREAGFQYVRETLKKAFPEALLTNEQMNEVLHKFDEAFKVTPDAPLLTLEEARTFIKNEREALRARSCYGKYVARYLNQESFINMRNGICYSIGMHLVPFALGILSYLYYLSLTHTVT
ncbi:MAG: hypothetical protein K2W97_06885 [Chthoniobacterales bacterium]|nr:hypothetical protein [Chthoniobacterales bacterium]